MNDEQLKQLSSRLNLDYLFLQKIAQRFKPKDETELIKLSNDVRALKAESGQNVTDDDAIESYASKQQPAQNESQERPQTPSTMQPRDNVVEQPVAPSPDPLSAPLPTTQQAVIPGEQQSQAGIDFYKKYRQGYKFKADDGAGGLGGQCAWFAEQITSLPDGSNWTIGSTVQEKQNQLAGHIKNGNGFYKGQATPEVGQSVIFGGGKYGHAAVVSEVLPNGKLRLTEANYNNDLSVRHDRIVDANDPSIMGYLKTKPKEGFSVKPAEEVRQDLTKQGVETNETTPPEPQLPQNVNPENSNEVKAASQELEPINKEIEQQRLESTPIKNEEIVAPTGEKPPEAQTSLVSNDLQKKILDTIPENQRDAASKALPDIAEALNNEGILTPKTLGYAMATASHESGFVPKEEKLAQRGLNARNDYIAGLQDNYEGGKDFKGRGYIQLTHKGNYEKYGQRIGEDLVTDPGKLLDSKVSAKVLAAYMKDAGVADAVEKGDYTGARVRVQGRGATNAQFMPTTNSIAEMAKKITSTVGDQDITQTFSKTPLSQSEREKQVLSKGILEKETQQAQQFTGKPVEEKQTGKGLLSVFAQQSGGEKTPVQAQAVENLRAGGVTPAGSEGAVFQEFASNLGEKTGAVVSPEKQATFQQNVQEGNVYFSPAVQQAQAQKTQQQQDYQDPMKRMQNALSTTASGAMEQKKQFDLMNKPAVQALQSKPQNQSALLF